MADIERRSQGNPADVKTAFGLCPDGEIFRGGEKQFFINGDTLHSTSPDERRFFTETLSPAFALSGTVNTHPDLSASFTSSSPAILRRAQNLLKDARFGDETVRTQYRPPAKLPANQHAGF